jgi:hypothetical protein
MSAPAADTQARTLAFLKEHPGRTAWQIAIALGYRPEQLNSAAGTLFAQLREMGRNGQVVAVQEFRPQQGRQVNLWHLAPAGTRVPASSGEAARHRARNRVNQRRPRSRQPNPAVPIASAAWDLPDGPACAGADPDLFFPLPGQPADPAKAICGTCRMRAVCLARARANGERYGIWGGVDLSAEHGAAWSA